MNPSGCVRFARICAANNAEAEAILARYANTSGVATPDRHVRPAAKPVVRSPGRQWREDAPRTPGSYRWRLHSQWEEVRRTVDGEGHTYSHRFLQYVDAARVGGEWFY